MTSGERIEEVGPKKLSALEFFVGFDGTEVSFLEKKVLFFLKEALSSFLREVKASHGPDECQSMLQRNSFAGYVFRSEDGQSFGGDDQQQTSNPFEANQCQGFNTLPREQQRTTQLPYAKSATKVQSSKNLVLSLCDSSNASTCKLGRQFSTTAIERSALETTSMFCETLFRTMERHTRRVGLNFFQTPVVYKRHSLPNVMPSQKYLSTKRRKFA